MVEAKGMRATSCGHTQVLHRVESTEPSPAIPSGLCQTGRAGGAQEGQRQEKGNKGMWKPQGLRASPCTLAPMVLHSGQSSTSITIVPWWFLAPRLEQLGHAGDTQLSVGPRIRSCQQLPVL